MSDDTNVIEEKVTKEKNGVKLSVVILLCIIFSLLFGIGGWLLGTKLANKEDKKNEDVIKEEVTDSDTDSEIDEETIKEPDDGTNKEDESEEEIDENAVFVESTSIGNDLFLKAYGVNENKVKEEFKTIKFGDVSKSLKVIYYVSEETAKDQEGENVTVFVLRRDIYLEDKLVVGNNILFFYDTKDEAIEAIDEFKLEDFKSLKDTKNNKTYNMFEIDYGDYIYNGELVFYANDESYMFLIDQDGNTLKVLTTKYAGKSILGLFANESMIKGKYYRELTEEDLEPSDGRKYLLYPDGRVIDLYDNYFYYLGGSNGDICSFDEKKIVVENGKVFEKLLGNYVDELDVYSSGSSC